MSIRIALVGNPNCGKTTMFNALTGANQYVGNWPGVTVEKKEGKLKGQKNGEEIIITDLPGIYSLSPYTLEEVVSRDYLLKEKPDAIINLVDATNIERNLYLTTQVMELGIPVVIALNMMDLIRKNGDKIDVKKLGNLLGCEITETSALKNQGIQEVAQKAVVLARKKEVKIPEKNFSDNVEAAISKISELLPESLPKEQKRWYSIKLFEKDRKVLEQLSQSIKDSDTIEGISNQLEKEMEDDTESIITNERYEYIQKLVGVTVRKSSRKLSTSDRIDRVITNRVLGIPIFIVVMFVVYYISVTSLGTIVTDWTNDTLFGAWILPGAETFLTNLGANAVLVSLIVDGIIGGIGAMIGFAPQMAILFFFLSILEDCGYMVRIAFVMDRVFRRFGLSGKSFIPLLISSGCGVPGIMSSKTIENDNDRRLTIMTSTFIPCGAKLPVIALIAGVIMGGAWWMAPLMYFIGILAVLFSAVMLKKTRPFSGETAPFVMELPPYHIPSPKGIFIHVWERLKGFLIKAGTIIFLTCAVMWFLSSFGFHDGFGLVEDSSDSLLAVIGGFIAPIFTPLGFGNWQAVASSISGFAAKESIVSTIGILSGLGEEMAETDASLWSSASVMLPTAVAAFSFLVFNLLDSPCFAAISTIAKEMNDRKWFWFSILYQNVFAYFVALCIYQIGSLAIYGTFGVGTVVGFALVIIMLFLLFRPNPYRNRKVVAKRSIA
jgi:ferrous iron transport protein B